jgi:hypothetical protein
MISASGRAVIAGDASVVWNVDEGTPIWTPTSVESMRIVESNEQFMVKESWHRLWQRWLPDWKLETSAFRKLDDGTLLSRMKEGDLPWPSHVNCAGTLVLASDGTIREMPPRVNWPLLALCQAILALPLVLLWAVLRWRRRRNRAVAP